MTETISQSRAQRNDIADIYPLSPMQEGILFHTVTSPESGLYMPQTAVRLAGPVDGNALKAAWQAAINRHPILRSAFYWEEHDQPFQVVFRNRPLSWTMLDWSDARGTEVDDRLHALQASNRDAPFDLRHPPLIRLQWITLGGERWILNAFFHHIVLDGWSLKQLFNEAVLLYLREIGVSTAPLPATRPYSDYIGWLKRKDRDVSLQFWQTYLDGLSDATPLLTDQSVASFERYRWDCPADLRFRLKSLCADLAITLNTLLQGALGVLMARQTGRSDVVFGTTTSGRPSDLPGATSMVGLFINTLPVRVKIERSKTIAEWLTGIQSCQASTTAHDYVALRQIQGSGKALFDTLLVVENIVTEMGADHALPFKVEGGDFDERTHFPLTIWVVPKPDSLVFFIGYSRDTVEIVSIGEMMDALAAILMDMTGAQKETLGAFVDRLPPALETTGLVTPSDPPPEHSIPATRTAGEAPLATPTERLLAAAWREILKSDELDASSNFFELGGHSLLAARVISRMRRELSVEIPVRSLFDQPVLRDLAAHIDALQQDAVRSADLVEIEI